MVSSIHFNIKNFYFFKTWTRCANSIPSWICPKMWNRGLTRTCIVFSSSAQPALSPPKHKSPWPVRLQRSFSLYKWKKAIKEKAYHNILKQFNWKNTWNRTDNNACNHFSKSILEYNKWNHKRFSQKIEIRSGKNTFALCQFMFNL